ncbi:hypothetical protein GCM10009679_38580 [Saccharothrix algeriensis]
MPGEVVPDGIVVGTAVGIEVGTPVGCAAGVFMVSLPQAARASESENAATAKTVVSFLFPYMTVGPFLPVKTSTGDSTLNPPYFGAIGSNFV